MIGLIVNPIAGMGGSVGLRGTDGANAVAEARALGATKISASRARRAMQVVAAGQSDARILAAQGEMGESALRDLGLMHETVSIAGTPSAAATRRAALEMRDQGVSLLMFAGGDGTARDVVTAIGTQVPVIGIPSGVKMHSGAFAVTPEAAGRVALEAIGAISEGSIAFRSVEIVDADASRAGAARIGVRLYGHARVPDMRPLLQPAKGGSWPSDEAELLGACTEFAREMRSEVLYLVGPGSTAKLLLSVLGETGTLLGVDAVRAGRLVERDVSERDAMALAADGPIGIVVGVTGRQGFVFGRGNQPIGAEAIRRAWPDGVTIVAGAAKLAALERPVLHVDTGDPELDRAMCGYRRVRVGPGRSVVMRLGRW